VTELCRLVTACASGSRVRVRVRVTLRLTVSQSVSLGVEPNLGLLTRDIIFFLSRSLSFYSWGGALSDERSGLSCVSPLSIQDKCPRFVN
jgi:hypothetical protein